MFKKESLLCFVITIVFVSCTVFRKSNSEKHTELLKGIPTSTTKDTSAYKIKPYKDIVTSDAKTSRGLFVVHKVKEKYFFEIPDSLFDRDILIVNRIHRAAADRNTNKYGYAGDLIGDNIVQFSKGQNNKIFIRAVASSYRSKDSSDNGMYRALAKSGLLAITTAFDIVAYSSDSLSMIFDATNFINSDNSILGFDNGRSKSDLQLGTFQNDKSYIEEVKVYPSNLEIRTVKTYSRGTESFISYELNSSILLLPKAVMKPRYLDNRIGYFTERYQDFDENPQMVVQSERILRWRLEPKEEDKERYLRGELVEPRKPIVFYIDPLTPKKWVPYLIEGVNAWQKAFEKAGFKKAIYALEAPTDDQGWNFDDTKHSVIVYKPSDHMNANGPNVHDPRSGEILESHINWYHNLMKLLHEWYFVQAGNIDLRAQKMQFEDSLMGSLIKFVCSHEVGHTLGLMHNFGASWTVPVDSLRSNSWIEVNGISPSIMDYARFNYVAQPEDHILPKNIIPKIGAYDEWAIEWGYRWFPDFASEDKERAFLNKWVIDKITADKRLFFGHENTPSDPRCQSEDLGDNAVKAGEYGIKNLKKIIQNLKFSTREPGKGYEGLTRMHAAVVKQYRQYLFHAIKYLGGQYYSYKTSDQQGYTREFVSKKRQKEALQFLNRQLFVTPAWIADKELFLLTGAVSTYQITELQAEVIDQLLSQEQYAKFAFQTFGTVDSYAYKEFLEDLKKAIWSELTDHTAIGPIRRDLQKTYIAAISQILYPKDIPKNQTAADMKAGLWNDKTDMYSLIKNQSQRLIDDISEYLLSVKDEMSRIHLLDVRDRLKMILKSSGDK